MSFILLTDLRTRILERANMVGTSFVSTPELDSIINGEAAELHDDVCAKHEDYFTTSVQFVVADGSSTQTMPGAAYKVRGVDKYDGTEWFRIDRFDWSRRNATMNHLRLYGRVQANVKYRIVGQNIMFVPEEEAPGTYRLWYVTGYQDLNELSNPSLSFPQQWVECVIAGAAAKLLAKEESDPSVQLSLKAATKARVMAMATNRDAAAPMRIERVRHRRFDGWDDF